MNGAANWNGGGMHFSQDYGYGMVDAYNAVRMAEVWSLFGPAQTSANEESVTTSVDVDQPIDDLSTLEFQFTVDDFDLTIEHVELTLTLTHCAILDLNVYLVSPDGTETMLLDQTTGRPTAAENTLTWTFGIDGLRGELAEGVWTIRVEDVAGGFGNARFADLHCLWERGQHQQRLPLYRRVFGHGRARFVARHAHRFRRRSRLDRSCDGRERRQARSRRGSDLQHRAEIAPAR